MRFNRAGYLLGLLAGLPTMVAAQGAGMPKPGPEQEKLSYFAGRWTFENEIKPGVLGPGGKMTGTENCEWFSGRFHLVCRSEGTSPMGSMTMMGVLSYNTNTGQYQYYGIDNLGAADHGTGTVAGDTWSYTGDTYLDGKPAKSRYTITQASPDGYTWKWEASVDGGPWTTLIEGKQTRVK